MFRSLKCFCFCKVVPEVDASTAACTARAAKKRKVSSAKDADQTEAQPQASSSELQSDGAAVRDKAGQYYGESFLSLFPSWDILDF